MEKMPYTTAAIGEALEYGRVAAFQWQSDCIVAVDLVRAVFRVFIGPEDEELSGLRCVPVVTVPGRLE